MKMACRYDLGNKTPQQQVIIMKKDEEEKRRKAEAQRNATKTIAPKTPSVFPTAIFMKLTTDGTGTFNGVETMKVYKEFTNMHKFAWFSTNALSTGIAKKQRDNFLKAVNNGYLVEIYFAVGKTSGGNNDLMYKAHVLDIKSDSASFESPDVSLTPKVWEDLNSKIWIKISNIESVNDLSATDFVVESTGRILREVIDKSQYLFGYIRRSK